MQNKIPTQQKARAVSFKNYSDEDFVWYWDSVEYSFPAGEAVMIQDYLAIHFANHLAQRELLKQGKNPALNKTLKTEEMNKCFVHNKGEAVEADSAEQLTSKLLAEKKEGKKEVKKLLECAKCDHVAKSDSSLATHLKIHEVEKEFPDLKKDDKTPTKESK